LLAILLVIGTGESLGSFVGDLDEVSFYDGVLSNSEIAGLAAAGAAGK